MAITKSDSTILAHSYRETGRMLGVSERTIFSWVREGKLHAFKVGKTVRISTAAIQAFIQQNQINISEGS